MPVRPATASPISPWPCPSGKAATLGDYAGKWLVLDL